MTHVPKTERTVGIDKIQDEIEFQAIHLIGFIKEGLLKYKENLEGQKDKSYSEVTIMRSLMDKYKAKGGAIIDKALLKEIFERDAKDLTKKRFSIYAFVAMDALLNEFTRTSYLDRRLLTNMSLASSMARYKKLFCYVPSLPHENGNKKEKWHIPAHDMYAAYKVRNAVFNEVRNNFSPEYILRDFFSGDERNAQREVEDFQTNPYYEDSCIVTFGSSVNNKLVRPMQDGIGVDINLETNFTNSNKKIKRTIKFEFIDENGKKYNTRGREDLAIILIQKKPKNRLFINIFGAKRDLTEELGDKILDIKDPYLNSGKEERPIKAVLYVFEKGKGGALELLKNFGDWPKIYY